jgi:hypothetical protein
MRIIIDLDESGGVVVEREGGLSPLGGAIRVDDRIVDAISVIDAGPPPAWLLRALGVAPVAVRAAPEAWQGEDAGAARV